MEAAHMKSKIRVVLSALRHSLGGGEKEQAVGMVEEQFGTVIAKAAVASRSGRCRETPCLTRCP